MSALPSDVETTHRLTVVDVIRGIAVVGMFGYHLTWDLASLGFIARTIPFSPSFRLYSHAVASAFLFLAGVSLVLAQRVPFRWDRWARHIALIAGAALLVTLASALLFPTGLIGFGILHCIALALLVATPFLWLSPVVVLLTAIAVAILPLALQIEAFDTPALIWTGLGTSEPSSNDFRPFFPWAAPLFAGVALARFVVPRGAAAWLARWQGSSSTARLFAWGGRHSLAIYLIHQPIFLGVLMALAFFAPPDQEQRAFVEPCVSRCMESGGAAERCRTVCTCVSREMHALGLRERAIVGRLDEAERLIMSRMTQVCLRAGS